MESRDVIALMFTIFDALNDIPMGQNMLSKVKLYKMSDDEKAKLMKDLAKLYGLGVKLISRQFDDKERGMNELLEFYYGLGNKMKAGPALAMEVSEVKADRMEVASALTGVERYAASAWWKKAEFLFWDGKFQEALVCYQTADNPPENLWKIVECFKAMGRIDPAVGQLREIENFFKSLAPRAALAIAYVYRGAGRKAEEVSAFRAVMKKYRASGESSRAHQELESMGYKIGGGQDAE
jgi:tetratricopeptide (TPR) repeat protein